MKAKLVTLRSIPIFLLVLVSMAYYVAGVAALNEEFFHSSRYARQPFEIKSGAGISELTKEAQHAGLTAGDVLITIDGSPFTGTAQLMVLQKKARPGETLAVGFKNAKGETKTANIRWGAREGPTFSVGGLIALLTPVLLIPMLGLLVAYWILLARPGDLNAWLVFVLLSFPETAFGNLDWSFWSSPWYLMLGFWNVTIQIFVFVALLWFGIFFPERWKLDRRVPWFKWLVLVLTIGSFAAELRVSAAQLFDAVNKPSLVAMEQWADRIVGSLSVVCVVLFLVAMFDKLRSASTPDVRRRLRVLAVGSGLSLGPLLIIFGLVPLFGMDPHHGNWFVAIIPFFALFPLTLAYVLIVQRAMDVRILVRMGTKYLLARATLVVLQIAVGAFLVFFLILPALRQKATVVSLMLLVLLAAGLFRLFLMRDRPTERLQRWLDRKFFREAYNSELLLSELSDEARNFTEKGPLIDTVLRRISEVLHVPQIAIWLPSRDLFCLQHALGVNGGEAVTLPSHSVTVQHLIRTRKPATVYRDRPEEWYAELAADERSILSLTNTELLLPLAGRAGLMGLLTLGPKRSEEPYTPTDLRVLQSVAAQTGLALEVTELVQSLANETTQRERIRREIEIASEVQQRLFPQRLPELPGLSLAGQCRPALGVGGDYYDVFELADGRLGFAIGDVSGKGISAALLMAGLRASLRGLTLDGTGDLARMMQKVNRLVYEASASHRYATFFFATYDPSSRELCYVNAGHNSPMLLKNKSHQVVRLEAGGVVVGLLPFAVYEAQSVTLEHGDLLVAYTDGISEAMTEEDEEWGEERMLAAAEEARQSSSGDILNRVFQAADQFTAGAEQHDDMTLLIMKLEAV